MFDSRTRHLMKMAKDRACLTRKQRDLTKPVAAWFCPASLHEGPGFELAIILTTRGCSHYYLDDVGCTMCGYNNDTVGKEIPVEAIITQFKTVMAQYAVELGKNAPVVLKIFNSGSFFDPEDVPVEVQDFIMETAAKHASIHEIAVESRPEHVAVERVTTLKEKLRDGQLLDVGVGLETWNDRVRDLFINKGFSLNAFLKAHSILEAAGAGTKAYVFLKPPFMTESRACKDALATIHHLLDLNISTISINPATIHANTLLEELWNCGEYRPPWLWTVQVVLSRALDTKSGRDAPLIICDPVAPGKSRGPHNCKDKTCNQASVDVIRAAVAVQRKVEGLDPLGGGVKARCPCWLSWLDEMRC